MDITKSVTRSGSALLNDQVRDNQLAYTNSCTSVDGFKRNFLTPQFQASLNDEKLAGDLIIPHADLADLVCMSRR